MYWSLNTGHHILLGFHTQVLLSFHLLAVVLPISPLLTKKKLGKVSTSNGLAWSPDHQYMYFIDTPTRKVVQFEYDLNSGHIENPIDVIYFAEDEGLPDGMTIDDEGMLWIAHWGGSKISRWHPKNGKQILSVPIPAFYVTSCTFGGKDLNELYITTARMENNDSKIFPNAGGAPLEVIQSLLGHEKSETTRIYAQLSGKLRQDFYSKYF
ncbi:SMP-30/Gluconolaconase/LRE-like region-containing protein [Bacillus sp. OV194]|nr:SMP-30/Gluconolaconase/LRE-like region-containing protein [Bacillus sp. OV194]